MISEGMEGFGRAGWTMRCDIAEAVPAIVDSMSRSSNEELMKMDLMR